jgi:nitrate/TMAO reductase-like tetraheme cytochrome c subunit
MKKIFLFLCIILTSCAQVVQKIDSVASNPTTSKSKLHLVFSHNLSGETHPCGCRQFPLGGLPQVYGLFQSLKESGELFYVDTGDTFFASSVIPKSMYDSLSFAANNLAVGLQMVGLNLYVPGDQDFARGLDFLKNIANIRKFDFLISNLKDESTIKHKRFFVLEKEKAKIFFVGLVDPDAINTKEAELFISPEIGMTNILTEIKNAGYDQNNPYHRLIVLSHAGIDNDEKFAAKFPQIDWIIGSHSQSFLRYSRDVGNVKMVQTLSKNHYVGEITIDLLAKKEVDSYYLHEIRDELVKKADPNPLVDFINAHKSKMSELQMKEQVLMTNDVSVVDRKIVKYKNPVSCIECHKPQVNFWQGTPHSIAYATLMNAKEQNNLTCVKCHSLGLDDPKGFKNVKTLVQFKDHPIIDYWNKIHAESSKIKSVRKLSADEIRVVSKKWMELDKKMNVKQNFANVQCLNCHSLNNEHPFEMDEVSTNEKRETQIKNNCLTCHTPDQSPEWYLKDGVNEKVLHQNYKKVSCPLLQ